MKFSLSFLLMLTLALAACFAWFRWSQHETQIHDAIRQGDVVVVSRLFKRRPKLFTNNNYHSPSMLLSAAVESGNAEMLAMIAPVLLKHLPEDENGWNALSLAVHNNDLQMVHAMLESGWDPNGNEEFSLLREAQKQGYLEIVELLVQHQADPTLALPWACEQPNPAFAERLLDLGADPNAPDAFANAIRAGHAQLVEHLLDSGVNSAFGICGISDSTSRDFADALILNGDFQSLNLQTQQQMMENLLRLSDDELFKVVWPKLPAANEGKLHPILTMVKMKGEVRRPVEKLEILQQYDVIANRDEQGYSVLADLARKKCFADEDQITFTHKLLEQESDRETLVDTLSGCFHSHFGASRKVQLAIAKSIIATGQVSNIPSGEIEYTDGNPLHLFYYETVDETGLEIAKMLIASGADVNERGYAGRTPLHIVSENGCIGLVELFLNAGADPNLRTDNGELPIDLVTNPRRWRRPAVEHTRLKTLLDSAAVSQP